MQNITKFSLTKNYSEGFVHPGVRVEVVPLANLMTSVRECQAIASLKTLKRYMRDLILNPGLATEGLGEYGDSYSSSNSSTNGCRTHKGESHDKYADPPFPLAPGLPTVPTVSSKIGSPDVPHIAPPRCPPKHLPDLKLQASQSSYTGDTGGDRGFGFHTHGNNWNNSHSSIQFNGLREMDRRELAAEMAMKSPSRVLATAVARLPAPSNVPGALWATLKQHYNSSQLNAIKAVCVLGNGGSGVHAVSGSQGGNQEGKSSGTDTSIPSISTSEHGRNRSYSNEYGCNTSGVPATVHLPITLLQGPPGTGKTKVILGIISVLLAGSLEKKKAGKKITVGASLSSASGDNSASKANNGMLRSHTGNKQRVLVCAASNTAVDELVFRLKTQGCFGTDGQRLIGDDGTSSSLKVVRIGQAGGRGGVFSSLIAGAGSNITGTWGSAVDSSSRGVVMKVVEAASLDTLAMKRRKEDSFKLTNMKPKKILDIKKQILEEADVVCCTLSGAGSKDILEVAMKINNFRFDAVIIDEVANLLPNHVSY